MIKRLIAVLLAAGCSSLYAQQQANSRPIDKNIRNLKWSGFLRTRAWHLDSGSATSNGQTGSFNDGNVRELRTFQDLFFRNRFALTISPNISINTLFDVGTLELGNDDGNRETGSELGNPQVKIRVKNVYFRFRPAKNSEIQAGLMPLSFPGGYILAKDGAAVKYQHRLLRGRVLPYALFIKAFENSSEDLNGNTVRNNNFNDFDIYAVGSKLAFGSSIKGETYYIHSEDFNRFDSTINKTSPFILNWVGLHSQFLVGKFTIKVASILNWGFIQTNEATGVEPSKVNLTAGLWQGQVGYSFGNLVVSLLTEGATGDPANDRDRHSFQGISPSHGLTNILIANDGGLQIRAGGNLYGLHGYGLKLEYVFLGELSLNGSFVHFRGTRSVAGRGSLVGNELNMGAKYLGFEQISFFFTGATFLPGGAYTNLVDNYRKRPIFEVMFGAQVNY